MTKIFAYVCADPDCPENFRAVAHTIEPAIILTGQNAGKSRLDLHVACATGRTASEATEKLAAFLDKEIQRGEARRRDAEATSERSRAMHAAKREALP